MSVYSRIFNKQYQNLMHPGERLRFDWVSPLCILLLCATGLLFIYSAQISYDGGHWKRQLFWAVIGLGTYTTISAINYKIVLEYAHFIYFAGIIGLLLATRFSPISYEDMGARRWIDLGFTRVQPTEGAKIGT
ncbi:MAG: FtsW/RodA/SpoVE family cell cycle protein, partial [Lentimonas sp.]